jgi:hypothetical protein
MGEELEKLEKFAEYHQRNGLDPKKLKKQFHDAGFTYVLIDYHYPDTPDTFTKILIFLNRYLKLRSFHYYFSIFAIK